MQFVSRLDQIEVRFEELTGQLSNPAVISDGEQYRKAAKAHSELYRMISKYRQWKKISSDLQEARGMLGENDPELRQMAEEEVARLEPAMVRIEEDLKFLL